MPRVVRRPPLLHLPGPPGPLGSRLVAVPGLGLSAAVPQRALAELQAFAGSSIVALPGFGLPARRQLPVDPISQARRLLEELADLNLSRVVLIAHSASCQVVAEAAAQAPDRVAALVLIGATTDPRAGSWLRLAIRWVHTAMWERPSQLPLLVGDYRHAGLAVIARTMEAARHHRIDTTLAAVTCPVLLIRGRHDHIAPPDWLQTLAATAGRGQVESLPAGGHMIPLTHPVPLAMGIRRFLEDVDSHR